IGQSEVMEDMISLTHRVASSPAHSILIYGETGTGKGLLAQYIHLHSQRQTRNFVSVNCGAIPESLMEAEFFGYERGAFTGAHSRKQGLLEVAHKGTLFLDEVRDLPPFMQTKLLTVMDSGQFRRVGGTTELSSDIRFIAATNKLLFNEVKTGNFRDDLYYRLQVIAINVPPLRERGEDVLILSEYFLDKLANKYNQRKKSLSTEVKNIFMEYAWPGNVRELQNLLERFQIIEDGNVMRASHIPPRITRSLETPAEVRHFPSNVAPSEADIANPVFRSPIGDSESLDFKINTEAHQRMLIEHAFVKARGRISKAANLLNLSRHALRHQMQKLKIEK
ncbi:MAG: sigma 54-interacting transcriptional regulator, partial [Alphaproteobacteria bacterium]|nr:sigma 54-interacting transcriptional regulator [Alphaproteobacteria bacterium]